MKYYLTGKQAGLIDRYTQGKVGIPGLVLMEKAAEVAADELEKRLKDSSFLFDMLRDKILIVAESGNNGGDGVAVARILKTHGYDTYVYEINGISSKSDSYLKQVEIARNLGVTFVTPEIDKEEVFFDYKVVVDSIFGVGLTREVKGIQSKVIDCINQARDCGTFIFSIDIPSGISSTTGHVLGNAVRSHMTVTFQFLKYGMLVNEGREYSGEIICREIGLYDPLDIEEMQNLLKAYHKDGECAKCDEQILYEYTSCEVKNLLPDRRADSNKGTYGKVLIVAGSRDVYGAMYMSAEASLRIGAGLVKVVTDINNRDLLMDKLPEAMMLSYDSDVLGTEKKLCEFGDKLEESVNWADVILIGPGIGTNVIAESIMKKIVEYCDGKKNKKLILDADALNIIAKNSIEWFKMITQAVGRSNVVITPHIAEMSRLISKSVGEIKESPKEAAHMASDEYGVVTILKDARTYVTSPEDSTVYVNTTGNSGMSTGGSGDVLAGILAGLVAQMKDNKNTLKELAAVAVNLHGRAGDRACVEKGERSMTATDILVAICSDIC